MKGGITYTCVVGWADGDMFAYQVTTDLSREEVVSQVYDQMTTTNDNTPVAVGCAEI